jgi:hypothetical protein
VSSRRSLPAATSASTRIFADTRAAAILRARSPRPRTIL